MTRAEGRSILRGAGKVVSAPYRLVERRSHTLGLPPGTLSESHELSDRQPAKISVLRYDNESIDEHNDVDVKTALEITDASKSDVTWVDVVGVHDVDVLRQIGSAFDLHALVQEYLSQTSQRPKLEMYDDKLFVVVKMVRPLRSDSDGLDLNAEVSIEQVAFVVGDGFLISFQEESGDVFEPVRNRLRTHAGQIRERDVDYLLNALLDIIVDHYFIALEQVGDVAETLEERVFADPKPEVQFALNRLRREVVVLRKSVWPLREVMSTLLREEAPLISESTRVYLRDVQDHLIQAIDVLESLREVLGGLSDLYLSMVSFRMNEVMKVLTVVGTLFIPLSFLTGLYGMNFVNIPELQYESGYFVLLGVMTVVAVGTLVFFWKKRWL